MTIVITGATGFLGSRIIRRLLADTTGTIIAIVRAPDRDAAQQRLSRGWRDWPDLVGAVGNRVEAVCGDVSLPRLGLPEQEYGRLTRTVTHIIHSAAELELDGDLENMRRINVGGTARVLELARLAHADHGLGRYAHVSTAYVAGRRSGEISEEDLLDEYGFCNSYEQTKFEGERLVRQAMAHLPASVFRPGMVVGDSITGEIQSFNTVYVPLRLYLSGKLSLLPAKPDMPLNIVPVDYVAGAISRLAFDPRAVGGTFHLTVARQQLPRAKDLLDFARDWAARNLDHAPAPARFIPLPAQAGAAIAGRLGVPASLLSYFGERRTYRRDNAERILGPYIPDWEAILPRLLAYAARRGFLRRSNRTVHEQFVRRLQSKNLPIRIHDIDGATVRPRSGTEMCLEIGKAADSLRALGIAPGDRVGLVGLNSSRFLSLDMAIGLTGAVSVPLYYTAPVAEIKEILRSSGARMLFVGAPGMLDRLEELGSRAIIVSFCKEPPPAAFNRRVLPWEKFLRLGANAAAGACAKAETGVAAGRKAARQEPTGRFAPEAPAAFSDLATLRFTSGTTGAPKGVMFRHDQLLWLAEVLPSLLPWKARTNPARYLSFLPMNHVVEGILGMYAPSYIPAPVDVFFLEDFHELARALPRVRPTVFFSVPRFYEKVWARFSGGLAGRLYLSLPSAGPGNVFRKTLRPFLRMSLLRRVGLDKCAQIIAGSAPCNEGLLRSFRELGIEIHNAYGLTEAPLVTLNRYGANRLGAVGAPLPDTHLRIAEDGEVLVRGPQVATGCFGATARDMLDDGWLRTGDLGELDPENGLIIRGRKKEILITSYGKNIHPAKIEDLLRRIPGLTEAMVIGDNRPSLSALLWLKERAVSPRVLAEIDRSVLRVNGGLSRPEQVKRWAILSDGPAVDSGELTGNLKLRRRAVLERRSKVVDMLYNKLRSGAPGAAEPAVSGVLHFGESHQV